MARGTTSVRLAVACDRACAPCDCRDSPSACDDDGVPFAVDVGGDRLVVRGEALLASSLPTTLDRARARAWGEVWVRSHGGALTDPARARWLRERGVRGVLFPVFSPTTRVHDAIAGRPGALVELLRAVRAVGDAGLAVATETPLLESRLQDLSALVELLRRATGAFGRARFFVPRRVLPAALAPPRWDAVAPRLAAALARCDALGVAVPLEADDGIPPCVLGHDPALAPRVQLPTIRARRPDGFAHAAACGGCALADRCHGPPLAYHAAHQGEALRPFARRPKEIDAKRADARAWLPHQREAARRVTNWVLRPTIHCNQDCPFCSANETSANVLPPDVMLRRIARAARKGVRYLSFSGGEPTLSKDLVHFIRAASRLGIRDIELVTNGTLLDGDEKVRPLKEAGLNRAFVSLHGHDELVSRRATSKVGDHARTVRAIDALLAHQIDTELNHVISSLNYPYLPRFATFVADRWKRRVGVSFAFVTPQFRALDQTALIPRISEVIPYLRRAMRTMVDRGVPFTVGSRQGIPPCFLGEYLAWSDVFHVAARAHAEDEPQKTQGPRCRECRFARECTGLWKPYADRYGFDELTPVPGDPVTAAELDEILHMPFPPRDFDLAPEALRAPVCDDPSESTLVVPEVTTPHRLRVLPSAKDELRVVLVGSGPQALRLARAMALVPGLRLVGLTSPHLTDRDTAAFGACDRDTDLDRLLTRARPDALVIAAATTAHHSLALKALACGLPALVEKPITRTLEQAEELAQHPQAGRLMAAHAKRFAPGVVELCRMLTLEGTLPVSRVSLTVTARAGSPAAPAAWSREALLESLYHAVYTAAAVTGGGIAAVTRAEASRGPRPEWIRVALAWPSGVTGEIVLDWSGVVDRWELTARLAKGDGLTWRQEGPDEVVVRDTVHGERVHSVERGSDTEAMLAAFRDAVRVGAPSPSPAREGADTLASVHAVLEALAPQMQRPGAPRHVASPPMRG